MNSITILTNFRDIFEALFLEEKFISKYLVLFDRLIKDDNIPVKCYEETNDIVINLSEHLEDLEFLSNAVFDLPCDLMFDLYCRYCVLKEYLVKYEKITVSSYKSQKLFVELLNSIWLLGIPTFTRKLV
nr:MAG TPA: putative translation initiation factor 2 domain protein [Caudoviricetes sp.]